MNMLFINSQGFPVTLFRRGQRLEKNRGFIALVIGILAAIACAPAWSAATEPSTADHGSFESLQKDFTTAPEVTAACLECHTEAGKQIRETTHWTWTYEHPETGQVLGKRRVINSFCGMVVTNEPRCTSCHVGYGWKDMLQPPPEEPDKVDCLVCHDTTGEYWKFPTLAGHPTYEPREWPKGSGNIVNPPDLKKIAQRVGESSRRNCGSCHFYGGGGDGVKHGDLDSSLFNPAKSLDVHMATEGLDFSCSECHTAWGHAIPGSRYQSTARDTSGIDIPGRTDFSRASCESCHNTAPHHQQKLNDHVDRIACQTCHIPEFARGGVATKMWWDWSTAGKLDEEGKPITRLDANGHAVYLSQKGDFRYEENVQPHYAWFDGTVEYTLRDQALDVENPPITINRIKGAAADPTSRIWPFKQMRGKQPYDLNRKTLLTTHVFGMDETALWSNFSWEKALQAGTQLSGQPYSGEYGFIETTMLWPITHMVPPADQAVRCQSCHARQSRLAEIKDLYIPGRDRAAGLDWAAWILVLLVLVGVFLHALLRLIFSGRSSK